MKKIILSLIFPVTLLFTAYAQKYAFVDTEYILNNIPSYKAAQEQLDDASEKWQKEVENKYAEIDKMYKDYQSEKVLLTDDMKQKKEEEIMQKEREVKELQKQYFGDEGALYKKRQELIKPIQDDVYKAVKDLSTESGYALIFDTSSGAAILYFNPKFDVSDDILKKLGYKD